MHFRRIPFVSAILLVLLLAACGTPQVGMERTPTPAPTSTSTPLPTDSPIPLPTETPAPTVPPTPTRPPTLTLTPTATPTTIPTETPAASPTPIVVELSSPMVVDSEAGRLYMSATIDGVQQVVALAATDGQLLTTYDITGFLALDSVHGWLYVDRDETGLMVLDAQTGVPHTIIPLPSNKNEWREDNPAPQADPAIGQVLAFRDNVVYVADPEKGMVTRTIPFDIPKAEDCRMPTGSLPIEWATYDSARRILYLDFETYVCTPWFGHTLVSYDMTSGTEIAQRGVSPPFSATAFDGYLYGSSWFRMGDGFRWAWRDGRPWFESSDWSYGAPHFEVDPTRQWLYGLYAGGLHVLDARTMALIMIAPLPVDGQLVGYDPKTDQLYFLVNGGLRLWPASAIQPPTPQPLTVSHPPTTSVRSLVVSPTWLQDKTLFGIWNAEDLLGKCWVFGGFGGPLYVSDDERSTWSRSRGGLPDGCDNISALAVSPDYARDRTLLAGVIGLGIFRSTDGGQLWEPSSAGLLSMGIEQILLSPGFAWDRTAFARVAPAGGQKGVYRSRDGGRSWQALDINLYLVAMSPEFDQDHTLMGVAYSYVDHEQRSELHISCDGGDHWGRVGNTPAGKGVYLLSLAPLFEKWNVLFVFASDHTLYRSADGGKSWDAVLNIAYPIVVDPFVVPGQLVYASDIEVNRPVFLLVRIRHDITDPLSERVVLYRSGDGGLTWQEVELPEDVSPTALAISPNFAQDGLLFVGTADGRVLTFEDWTLTGQTR